MNTIEQVTTHRNDTDEIRTTGKALDCALTDEELDGVTGGTYRFVRAVAIREDGKNAQLWVTTST